MTETFRRKDIAELPVKAKADSMVDFLTALKERSRIEENQGDTCKPVRKTSYQTARVFCHPYIAYEQRKYRTI